MLKEATKSAQPGHAKNNFSGLNTHEDARLKGLTREIRVYNPAGALDLAAVATFIIPNENAELVGTFLRKGAHPNTATVITRDERHR